MGLKALHCHSKEFTFPKSSKLNLLASCFTKSKTLINSLTTKVLKRAVPTESKIHLFQFEFIRLLAARISKYSWFSYFKNNCDLERVMLSFHKSNYASWKSHGILKIFSFPWKKNEKPLTTCKTITFFQLFRILKL